MTRPLTALRAATAEEHGRLERRLDLAGRVRAPGGYRGLLAALWGIHVELEPRLERAAAATGVLPGWSRSAGLGWLAADLDDLGCGPEVRRGLPRCAELPGLGDADRVWGCLYVVEGASLGGGVIADGLAARGSLPTRFFRSHGEARGRRWHRFRGELGRWLDGAGSLPVVVDAARETFEAFERWSVPEPVRVPVPLPVSVRGGRA